MRTKTAITASRIFAAVVLLLASTLAPAARAESTMDHGSMEGMDHSTMPGMKPAPAKPQAGKAETKPLTTEGMDQSMPGMQQGTKEMAGDKGPMEGMQMGPVQGGKPPPDARDPHASSEGTRNRGLPGNQMADMENFSFLLVDKLEFNDAGNTLRLDAQAWYGGDIHKLWLKTDGERQAGRLGATRTEALWDRRFATYWSTQLGVRHDFGDGPGRNWAAIGVEGLARYWFDIEATAYVGESGRTAARVEAEYDLLLTQRLIVQPNLEMNFYGKNDAARNIGSGLSDMELGVRMRYEISRQFAPYIGVSWQRKFGNTADFARAAGEDVRSTRFIAGVRMWF
jgi:copper resistance protein B